MFWRALIIFLLIACLEVVQGILRVRFVNRILGDHRARQVGVVISSAMILVVAWMTVPWIGVVSRAELFGVGTLWLALMLAFDLAIGRFAFHMTWCRIARDFDVRHGGLLGIGMLILLFAPLLAAWMRGLI